VIGWPNSLCDRDYLAQPALAFSAATHEWDIATALSLEVDAKKHSATFAHHVFFAFEAPLADLPGALLGVLQATKKGGYALLNRGPQHYEHGKAILTYYQSIIYRGTRCTIIPTERNKTQLIATKCTHRSDHLT
jgi:hypothetical protein